jgi:hypothetical protein
MLMHHKPQIRHQTGCRRLFFSTGAKCDACDALQDLEVVGVGFAEVEADGVFGGDGKIMVISCFWFK